MADVTKLSEGTVDDAKDALPGLSDSDLTALNDAEKDGKNRSTLLDAIKAEQDSRGDTASGASEEDRPEDEARKARLETMTPAGRNGAVGQVDTASGG